MNFIEFFESISFKKLTALTAVLALSLMVPLSVWTVRQETKIQSRAVFEKPEPTIPAEEYGQPSPGQPRISLVWPFLGKTGDAVLVYGENFGKNPEDKSLFLGPYSVPESQINQWTPVLIEFKIPPLLLNGAFESLSLTVAGQKAVWDLPLTVYDVGTKIRVTKPNGELLVSQAPAGSRMTVFFNDGEKMITSDLIKVTLPEGKTIVSLLIEDQNGRALPFFVEPREFNF